jgi:PBP1b-binding outer membrane lipoprotein LpoB
MKSAVGLFIIAVILSACVQPNPVETNQNGNSPPEINSVITDPVFITVGTTANITVDATDPDGDALSYSWSVALGDIIDSGSKVKYTAAYCCVGVNTVHFEVKDSRGASVKGTIDIEVNP